MLNDNQTHEFVIINAIKNMHYMFIELAKGSGWRKNYNVNKLAHERMLNLARIIKKDFPRYSEQKLIIDFFESYRNDLEYEILSKIDKIDFSSQLSKYEIELIEHLCPKAAYELGICDEIIGCLYISFNNIFFIQI